MLGPVPLYLGPLQRANPLGSPSDPRLANTTKSSNGGTKPRSAVYYGFLIRIICNDAGLGHVVTDINPTDKHVENDAIDLAQSLVDPSWHLDFSQFNAYGTDCLTDAWFGQQLMNLDWMDFPALPE